MAAQKTKPLTEIEEPHSNGNVVTLPTGPRMPKRAEWVDLPPEYAGMRVKFWVNYPSGWNQRLRSGDETTLQETLSQIVLEHNGWLDEAGEPYPPSSDPTFWQAISDELMAILIALLMAQVAKLPSSIRGRAIS